MKRTIAILLAAPLVAAGSIAAAQDYPNQPITVIVPYSPGGGGDTVARIVADRLGEELGQTINVVNREGAGGEVGIAEMARAKPDGYTLGVFGYPDNVVIENTRDADFDSGSFDYLAGFDLTPMGMFAAPGTPFEDLEGACASMPRPIPAVSSWANPARSAFLPSSPSATSSASSSRRSATTAAVS